MTEMISALLDGQLDDESQTRSAFDVLRQDRNLRNKWGTYCLIGDVLRGEGKGGADFTAQVLSRLESEPTVVAPIRRSSSAAASRPGRVGRVVLPVAASVMGVTAVGWVMQSMNSGVAPQVVAMKAPPPSAGLPVAAAPAPQADPLRSYVFAHQALAGAGSMPGVAQYVRTVSEARQGPDR